MAPGPLIYLDVDGPLIPFGLETSSYPLFGPSPQDGDNPLLGRLDPSHGLRLKALPVVDWPEPSDTDEFDARVGLHWKTRPLLDHARGRPFAWIDD